MATDKTQNLELQAGGGLLFPYQQEQQKYVKDKNPTNIGIARCTHTLGGDTSGS